MKSKTKTDLLTLSFNSALEWEAWLAKNHDSSPGIWLCIQKKKPDKRFLTYSEALDVALCYGWIDGQKRPNNSTSWLQKFTVRRQRSSWSKKNTERAEMLIQCGRMKTPGHVQIQIAKKDGRWLAAYDSPSKATVPEDFMRELSRNKKALAFFKTLNRANVYAIVYRLQTAKKPETRAKRMDLILQMMANGEKFH